MSDTTGDGRDGSERNDRNERWIDAVGRRTVLRAAGASAALSLGAGTATAAGGRGGGESSGGTSIDGWEQSPPASLDPLFGWASAERNPCGGDASDDCFDAFPDEVRPSHEVEMRIGIPGLLFAVAGAGGLSQATTESINEEVADGEVRADRLHRPHASVTVQGQEGPESVTVREIAHAVAETTGFHFGPAGLAVEPGDVVLFSAESPDHAVAAFHERHGRQNRVPDGVGPFSSPLVPVEGLWLHRFDEPGVYDVYCPPHAVFGMVMRIVVHDGSGEVPSLSVEDTGRPPEAENTLPSILGGLDPNVPSSREVLTSDLLDPEHVVSEGAVSWHDVVADHRDH
jgi:plastocyanin